MNEGRISKTEKVFMRIFHQAQFHARKDLRAQLFSSCLFLSLSVAGCISLCSSRLNVTTAKQKKRSISASAFHHRWSSSRKKSSVRKAGYFSFYSSRSHPSCVFAHNSLVVIVWVCQSNTSPLLFYHLAAIFLNVSLFLCVWLQWIHAAVMRPPPPPHHCLVFADSSSSVSSASAADAPWLEISL